MQRVVAIVLSTLLLISSTGLTYAEHYCGSHKMMGQIALGHAHMSCGMSAPKDDCEQLSKLMDCCDNHYLSVDTDEDYAKVAFDFEPVIEFLPAVPVNIQWTAPAEISKVKELPYYRPPPDELPLFILYETYLI